MNNKLIRKNDFLNSISIIAVVVSFVQLLILLKVYVFHDFSAMSTMLNEYDEPMQYVVAFYCNADYSLFDIYSYMYAIFGMIAGVSQFFLMFNKQKLFSAFSIGIKRKTFAENRILSGLLLICLSSFVPITISLVINMFANGVYGILFGAYACQIINVVGLNIFGFMMGTLGCLLCKNVGRAVLGAISITAIPYCTLVLFETIAQYFLRGKGEIYSIVNISRYLPCCGSLRGESVIKESALLLREDEIFTEYWLPALVLTVASVIMLVIIEKKLIYKCKPENAGIKDFSYIPSVFTGIFVGFLAVSIFLITFDNWTYNNGDNWIYNNGTYYFVTIVAALVSGTVASIITSLILSRKRGIAKIIFNALPFPAIIILLVIITATGCFGFTTRVPKASEVESVSLRVGSPYFLLSDFYGFDSAIQLTSEADIEKVIEANKAVAKTPKNAVNVRFDIDYHLKNDEMFERSFLVVDESALDAVNSIFNTDAVRENYKNILFYEQQNYEDEPTSITCTDENNAKVKLFLVRNDLSFTDIRNRLTNAEFTELKKAILEDYCNASYKQLVNPGEKPLCVLAFTVDKMSPIADNFASGTEEFDDISTLRAEQFEFYIYSFMKNTVKFFDEHKLTSLCADVRTPVSAEYIVYPSESSESFDYGYYYDNSIEQDEYWALSGVDVSIGGFTNYDGIDNNYNAEKIDESNYMGLEKCDENIKTVYKNAYLVVTNEKDCKFVLITFDDGFSGSYYVKNLKK